MCGMNVYIVCMCVFYRERIKQGSLGSFASVRTRQCTVLRCGFQRSELITIMNFLFSSGSVEY